MIMCWSAGARRSRLPFARIAEDFEGALRRMHAGRNGNTGSR